MLSLKTNLNKFYETEVLQSMFSYCNKIKFKIIKIFFRDSNI